jgi:hypothetical protein
MPALVNNKPSVFWKQCGARAVRTVALDEPVGNIIHGAWNLRSRIAAHGGNYVMNVA